ncbi:hypothetical protein [Rhizobium sp. BR 315]|uniref:hypothetical protein n=1 Tax=Rhizobium sp. BR 315 TaxID=3040014 RepID=UPI003D345C99
MNVIIVALAGGGLSGEGLLAYVGCPQHNSRSELRSAKYFYGNAWLLPSPTGLIHLGNFKSPKTKGINSRCDPS